MPPSDPRGEARDAAARRLALESVPGTGGVIVEPLSAGLVNAVYRVRRSGRIFSLRVTSAGCAAAIDRHWECRVLREASRLALAPGVEHCDAERGVLVLQWVDGVPWTAPESRRAESMATLASLLRRVHSLAPAAPWRRMSPAAWIAHYRASLAVPGAAHPAPETAFAETLRKLAEPVDRRLQELETLPAGAVLCHGDLHRLNLMAEPRPVLLDWEYAHVSDPFWDLAGWLANEDWTAAAAQALLAAYLERTPAGEERRRLELLVYLYDYTCLLWSRLCLLGSMAAPASPTRTAVAIRAAMLAERLAHAG